jgi:hypothetical protein
VIGDLSRILPPAFLCIIIAGCQPASNLSPTGGKSAALRKMEHVAAAAHRCWFASGDETFRAFSFANELDSHSGRPRFLLVPKNDFGGRPLLVVEAQGPAGRLSAFGPLLEGPDGRRIAADIRHWAEGGSGCDASA